MIITAAEPTAGLQRYLNPEYWDGHTMGYGLAEAWPDYPNFGRGLQSAKASLRGRIARMATALPLETYSDGEVFDADAHEPGTLVIFREEALKGRAHIPEADIEALKEQPLPSRPLDVSPSFGPTADMAEVVTDGGNLVYFTVAKWGIVTANRSRRHTLDTISTGLVEKKADEVVIRSRALTTSEPRIKIGETRHYRNRDLEGLVRVNTLDVVAHGEVRRSRRSLLEIIASRKPQFGVQ